MVDPALPDGDVAPSVWSPSGARAARPARRAAERRGGDRLGEQAVPRARALPPPARRGAALRRHRVVSVPVLVDDLRRPGRAGALDRDALPARRAVRAARDRLARRSSSVAARLVPLRARAPARPPHRARPAAAPRRRRARPSRSPIPTTRPGSGSVTACERPFVLFAGRREGGKGWRELLAAYGAAVVGNDAPFDLVTVGVGAPEIPEGLAGRVVDLGYLDERGDAERLRRGRGARPAEHERELLAHVDGGVARRDPGHRRGGRARCHLALRAVGRRASPTPTSSSSAQCLALRRRGAEGRGGAGRSGAASTCSPTTPGTSCSTRWSARSTASRAGRRMRMLVVGTVPPPGGEQARALGPRPPASSPRATTWRCSRPTTARCGPPQRPVLEGPLSGVAARVALARASTPSSLHFEQGLPFGARVRTGSACRDPRPARARHCGFWRDVRSGLTRPIADPRRHRWPGMGGIWAHAFAHRRVRTRRTASSSSAIWRRGGAGQRGTAGLARAQRAAGGWAVETDDRLRESVLTSCVPASAQTGASRWPAPTSPASLRPRAAARRSRQGRPRGAEGSPSPASPASRPAGRARRRWPPGRGALSS